MAMEFDAAAVPASSGAQPNDRTATLVAETTTTQSSTPQTVTVALEAGDIVHLPAGTDISHMVQVGNDLEFIQPDGTVIVIPNGAVADLTVFVGNVEIPADTVAALYQTNNIHPAEGPAGGQGGGHEFNDPGPHGIGNAFGLTPLLGPNSLSFESNDVNTLEDTDFLPVWGTNPVILLDVSEEGLGSGNPDTNPDPGVVDTTNLTVRTGSLGVTDQDNDFLTFKLSGPSSPLTSDGHLISWSEISTAGTEILLGTDSVTHQAVLELTVTNARPSDGGGNYVLQLFQAIDHPVHGQEDNLAISLGVTVTDSKSAPVPATIVLTVEDDSPVVASSEAGQNLIVNGQFNDGTFIDLSGWAGQAATGSIPGWTIDGPQLERNPPDWYVSSDPAAGGKVVDLDASPGDVKITQTVTGLTDGEHYVLTFDASKPLGFDAKMNVIWNGNIVGVIDPTATSFSHYSFDLEANGSTGTLSFSEVGAPDNGGTFLANVELRDAGSFVDEDGLLNGIPGGPGDVPGASTVATEALNIKWGADNFDTSDVNGIQDGANSVGGLTGRALYFTDDTVTASFGSTAVTLQSAGETVHYELLANGTELVGYTGTFDASNQSNWVFTATLSDDDTGSYSFTLLKPLDHPVTNTEDNLALSFNITARDSDGDTAATGFTVSVNDDSPTVTASIANLADGLDFGSFTPNGNAWGQGSGTATGTNGGWTIAGSGTGHDGSGTIQLERVGDGYDAMHSSTHGYMVDLDASPHDVEISQKITGLSAGEQTVLHFEAGVPVGGTGTLEVWFGGQLIQTINPTHAMTGYSITLTGGSGDGKDILEFREVGAPDNVGTYLANVSVGGIIIDETPGIQGDSSEVAALSIFNSVVNPGSEMPAQYAQGSSPAVAVDAKYGADGPAASNALVYALSVTNGADSGLQTTDGHEIYLYNENGLVVGRYESDGSAGITTGDKAAFAFQLDSTTGVISMVQYVSLHHGDTTSPNDTVQLDAGTLNVKVTVTDGDGDTAQTTVDVSKEIGFRDDGPTLASGQQEAGTVNEANIFDIWTQGTSPDWFGRTDLLGAAHTNGSLSGLVNFGADGFGSFSFTAGATTQLEALHLTSNGHSLSYTILNGVLVGYVDNGQPGPSLDDRPVFMLTLTANGSYDFELFSQLDHDKPASGEDTNTTLQDNGQNSTTDAINFGQIIQATDGDGDHVTLDGAFKVTIVDDVPQVWLSANPLVYVGIDESAGSQDGYNIFGLQLPPNDTTSSTVRGYFTALEAAHGTSGIGDLGNDTDIAHAVAGSPAIAYAHGSSPVVVPVINAGADGVASVAYSLQAASEGVYSGVQTTDGHNVYLYEDATGLIVGRVGGTDAAHDDASATGTIAFAIAIEQNGDIDIAQYLSLNEPDTHDNNDRISILDGALKAVVTVTDGDGDVASDVANIGSHIQFYDDGPALGIDATHSSSVLSGLDVTLDETVGADRYSGADNVAGDTDVNGGPNSDDVAGALGQRTTSLSGSGLLGLFSVSANAGADGLGSQNFQLSFTGLSSTTVGSGTEAVAHWNKGIATNLSATHTSTTAGGVIELFLDTATNAAGYHDIVGYDAAGNLALRIAIVDVGGQPQLQTTLYEALNDGSDGNKFDSSLTLQLSSNASIGLKYAGSVTDGDGDTASDSATVTLISHSRNPGYFVFQDDGPAISGVTGTLGPNLVQNGSFEDPSNVPGGWQIYDSLTGWQLPGGVPVEVQTGAGGLPAEDGSNLVELDSDLNGNGQGGSNTTGNTNVTIAQTITTVVGQTYELSFWASPRPGHEGSSGMTVSFGGSPVLTLTPDSATPDGWQHYTVEVTATSTSSVLSFTGTGSQDSFGELLDNVSLQAVNALDDEDTGSKGIQGGPGDDGNGVTATGQVKFDAGADGLKSIAIDAGIHVTNSAGATASTLSAIYVDSNGVGTPETLTEVWVANTVNGGGTLYGVSASGTHFTQGNPAFTLHIAADGTYTFTLDAPLDHPFTTADNTAVAGSEYEDNLTLNFGVTVTDGDNDTANATISINVDDDSPAFINGGIEGGTVTALNTSVTKALNIAFGADGENASHGLVISGWEPLDGVSYGLSDDGKTLTAKIGNDTLYVLQLNDDGTYTFTQDHTLPGSSGTLPAESLSDSYGPTASHDYGNFTLIGISGEMNGSHTGAGVGDDNMNVGDEFRIAFDQQMTSADLGIKFEGNGDLHLHWVAYAQDGTTVVASGDTGTFGSDGTLSITPSGAFYTLDVTVDLDSGNANSPKFKLTSVGGETEGTNTLDSLTFQVAATDGDGDSASDSFSVHLHNHTPPSVNDATDALTVHESALSGGSNPGSGTADTDNSLSFTAGSEAITVAFADPAVIAPVVTGLDTTDGYTVTWRLASGELIGTLHHNGDAGVDAITLSLSGISGNAGATVTPTVTATLTAAMHDATGGADVVVTGVQLVASDANGGTAAGSVSVNVVDDVPSAKDYTGGSFAEGSGSHDIGLATTLLGIAAGADGLGGTLQGIVFTNLGANGGSLSIDSNGELIYTPPTDVQNNVTETFSYTVTDGDGDSVTKQVSFDVTNTVVTVTAADDHVITNIVDGSPIVIPDAALLANDTDAGGKTLTITGASGASGGDVSHSLGSVTFSPPLKLSADFATGADGFTYSDKVFDSSGAPAASNSSDGGSLQVTLGGQDSRTLNSNGAYSYAFTTSTKGDVTITFDYRGTLSGRADDGEDLHVLASVDGSLLGTNGILAVLKGHSSTGGDTGWQTVSVTFSGLAAGNHTLSLGGLMTSENQSNETAQVNFDNVTISPEVPFASGGFDYSASDGTATDDGHVTISAVGGSTLTGTGGSEIIIASSGDDTIDGKGGADFISGGDGSDKVTYYNVASSTLDGGADGSAGDTLIITGASVPAIDLSSSTDQTSGDNTTVTNFENVDASAATGSVNITGSDGANVISVGSGGGMIKAGDGEDVVTINTGGSAANWSVDLGTDNSSDKLVFKDTGIADSSDNTVVTIDHFDTSGFTQDRLAVVQSGADIADGSFTTVNSNGTNIAGKEVIAIRTSTSSSLTDDSNNGAIENIVAAAIGKMQAGDYTVVVYSNQTGIADAGIYKMHVGSDTTDLATSGFAIEHIATLTGVGYGNLSGSNFVGSTDPLILDLDHNGLSFGTTASFDINGDGTKDQVAWNTSNDGILALDVNGNGQIDNGNELFTTNFNGGHYASGVDALASLDSNHDGVIDARDIDFSKLQIWQDANHDGVVEQGEMSGLTDHGIASIGLTTTATDDVVDGQSVTATGTFTLGDGSTGTYSEVGLDTSLGAPTALLGVDDPKAFSDGVDWDNVVLPTTGQPGETLQGTDGADKFTLTDAHAVDFIADYNFAQGDTVDLSALLGHNSAAPAPTAANAADFVHYDSGSGMLSVDVSGSGHDFVDVAVLNHPVPDVKVILDDGVDVTVNHIG